MKAPKVAQRMNPARSGRLPAKSRPLLSLWAPFLSLWAGGVACVALLVGCGSDPGAAESRNNSPARETGDRDGMVEIPGGTVRLEGRTTTVAPFLMKAKEVTNDEFAKFVEATEYVTQAEEIGNSVVFHYGRGARGEGNVHDVVDGADWRHPLGPESSIEGKGDHPVIHVSWHDASAYASWRGWRLPSGPEWVFASKGGLEDAKYPWGTELRPQRLYQMNAWQGTYPVEDSGLDGYRGPAPAGSFPANGYGLYDVAGNVWEWTAEVRAVGSGAEDRVGAVRGGSFLCRERAIPGESACRGYEIGSVQWKPLFDGNHNVGFRCAMDL